MTAMNQEQFTQQLLDADKPILVEYWAPWCVYCRRLAPALKRLSSRREDIQVVQINIDDNPELAQRERIEVIPTLVLYEKGQSLGSIVAPESGARIEDFLLDTLGQ